MDSGPQAEVADCDLVRFCTHHHSDLLGSSIQGEFLYLVQPCKISVYEFHGRGDRPQPTEELIHNATILAFAINRDYICTFSAGQLEVRDRRHWSNVIMARAYPLEMEEAVLVLNDHELYVSRVEQERLFFDRVDLQAKQLVSTVDMGAMEGLELQFVRENPPIFVRKLGMMSDFYIMPRTGECLELGVLFKDEEDSMKKFEMNKIELKMRCIKQVFLHSVEPQAEEGAKSEFLVIVAQHEGNWEVTVHVYEISSRVGNIKPDEPYSSGVLQELLKQFTLVSQLTEGTDKQSESLVNEVLSQAMKEEGQVDQISRSYTKLDLAQYVSSCQDGQYLQVASKTRICSIKLSTLPGIAPASDSSKQSEGIIYMDLPKQRQLVGVYGGKPLYSSETISYEISCPKLPVAQIEEEIEEYDVNDEILDGQARSIEKQDEATEKMRNDIFMVVLEETEKQLQRKERMKKSQEVKVECPPSPPQIELPRPPEVKEQSSSTEVLKVIEYGTQTDEVFKRHQSLEFEEVQDLVLKYSTSLTAHCNKVKNSQYNREKIEKEVEKVVKGVATEQIQPYLQQQFFGLLGRKVNDILSQISGFLVTQMENLNEQMRKAEAKEGNLRGKRIFDFATQVTHIKQTIGGVIDSFKTSQNQRRAFNEVILEEAKEVNDKVTSIELEVKELAKKSEAAEEGIRDQVREIGELMRRMGEGQRAGSESWMEESGDESEQDDQDCSEDEQASEEQSEEEYHIRREHRQMEGRGRVIQIREEAGYSLGFGGTGSGYSPYPSPYYPPQPQAYPPPQSYYQPYPPPPPHFHSYPTPQPHYPPPPVPAAKPRRKKQQRS